MRRLVKQGRENNGRWAPKPTADPPPRDPDVRQHPAHYRHNDLSSAIQQLQNLVYDMAEHCGIRQPEEWHSNEAENILTIYHSVAESNKFIPPLSSLQVNVEHRDLEVRAVKAAACLIFICSEQAQTNEQLLEAVALVILAILGDWLISGQDKGEFMANTLKKVRFLLEPSHIIQTVPSNHNDDYLKTCETVASVHWDIVVAISDAMAKEMAKRYNNEINANYDGRWLTYVDEDGHNKKKKVLIDPDSAEVDESEGGLSASDFSASEMKKNYLKKVNQASVRASGAECLGEVASQDGQPIEPASGQQRLHHAGTRPTQRDPQRPTPRARADDAQPDYRNSDSAGSPKSELHFDDGTDQSTQTRPSPDCSDHQSDGANSVTSQIPQIEDRDESSEDPDRSPPLGRWIRSSWVWVLLVVLLIGVLVLLIGEADSVLIGMLILKPHLSFRWRSIGAFETL